MESIIAMSFLKEMFTVSRKTYFNPTAWAGISTISELNDTLVGILKPMFTKHRPTREETFPVAMQRLGLVESEIETRIQRYSRYALIFVFCGLMSLFYGFYLLFRYHTLAGWFLAMGASGLFFSQAYQYDFWALQMKKRTLGLTWDDYIEYRFGTKGQS